MPSVVLLHLVPSNLSSCHTGCETCKTTRQIQVFPSTFSTTSQDYQADSAFLKHLQYSKSNLPSGMASVCDQL